jgi:hypothetical protein
MTDATTISPLNNSPRLRESGVFLRSQSQTGVTTMIETATAPGRRWASRKEAMAHMRVGSTKMNEILQAGLITAKKHGAKVIVDLNSVDQYVEALPNVGSRS